jgi:hypothetical protein
MSEPERPEFTYNTDGPCPPLTCALEPLGYSPNMTYDKGPVASPKQEAVERVSSPYAYHYDDMLPPLSLHTPAEGPPARSPYLYDSAGACRPLAPAPQPGLPPDTSYDTRTLADEPIVIEPASRGADQRSP